MRRSLVLKKDTLTELGPADLGLVAGGALTPQCPVLPTRDYGCRIPTDHCVSLADCLSNLMHPCLTDVVC